MWCVLFKAKAAQRLKNMVRTKKRKSKAHRRHIRQPKFVYRKFVLIGLACVALIMALFGAHALFKNWSVLVVQTEEVIAKVIEARVKTIMVSGVKNLEPHLLKTALNLEEGSSLVGFDAGAARVRVEALNWVDKAYVVRVLPSTIKVNLQEHTPIARLEEANTIWLVAHNGHKIAPSGDGFAHLPLLRGIGAQQQLGALFAVLAQAAQVQKNVLGATYVGERRWDLHLKGGVLVKLPETDVPTALTYLMLLQQERQIMHVKNAQIDLRIKDRVVLKLPESTQ